MGGPLIYLRTIEYLKYIVEIVVCSSSTIVVRLAMEGGNYAMKVTRCWDIDEKITRFLHSEEDFQPFLVPRLHTFHDSIVGFREEIYRLRIRWLIQKFNTATNWERRGRIARTVLGLEKKLTTLMTTPGIWQHAQIVLTPWAEHRSLSDLLSNYVPSPSQWLSILTQVFYALALIQSRYPSFRHNDLHPANILVFQRHAQLPATTETIVLTSRDGGEMNVTFRINWEGLQLCLCDFEYSSLPEILSLPIPHCNPAYGISVIPNLYYDLHTFSNHLLLHHQTLISECHPIETLLKDIVPPIFRSGAEHFGRISRHCEHTTAAKILQTHPYFESVRRDRTEEVS